MEKRELEYGDVVQLNPQHGYGGMLVVVNEPKEFGCQGYLLAPGNFEAVRWKGKAYLRPKWEDMEYVGKLYWVEKEIDSDSEH